jgi:hypothetical protein
MMFYPLIEFSKPLHLPIPNDCLLKNIAIQTAREVEFAKNYKEV